MFFTTRLGVLKWTRDLRLSKVNLLTSWLKGKLGRKVRLKCRDIEAEASTVEELRSVMELIREKEKTADKDESGH